MRWELQTSSPGSTATWFRVLRAIGNTVVWFILALLTLWAAAALYFDLQIAPLRIPAALIYVFAIATNLFKLKRSRAAAALCLVGFLCVFGWWLTLKPSNDGNWQADVAQTAWAEMDGDRVTFHNLRNCDYRTETDYANCWSDRTIYLSHIRAADLFLTNWGIPLVSHPIVSFQFGDGEHVAFSIEARYIVGQSHSTILGFFRQYELIFIAADERDVVRLRTNYRKNEEVYLYRDQAQPDVARAMFLTYVTYMNKLKDHPEWYNELTRNCTTTIQRTLAADTDTQQPWNYQYILNGTLDKLLYERGRLVTGGLPFPELKQREHINAAAQAAKASPNFSAIVRMGRIGF
ncbi:MAG TPA: DUF4105 domain-containing protein [Candidatus Sulfotelmatobacter sp.]|nr:DUF4105 domain-containing protein [Candidatus Sulfotelmatobacter sp.]